MTDKGRLDIHQLPNRSVYYIAWFFDDEFSVGAILGENPNDGKGKTEHAAACRAVKMFGPGRDGYGWYFSDKTTALVARRAARAAVRAHRGKSLPAWAKQALAAGWKKPRGWKP